MAPETELLSQPNPLKTGMAVKHIYTLECDYYHEEFNDIFTLARTVIKKGVDPNLYILRDGIKTEERPIDLIVP